MRGKGGGRVGRRVSYPKFLISSLLPVKPPAFARVNDALSRYGLNARHLDSDSLSIFFFGE
jgi:hypothetical protein